MFTLSPGPSQISPETKQDIRDAIDTGVLELSHRSSKFTAISRNCIEQLRAYLNIPPSYRVFYFDSATQVWDSLISNLVVDSSAHFINGAFSAKARDASKFLYKNASFFETPWGTQNDFANTNIPRDAELITACFNETSTGVRMLPEEVRALKAAHPDAILAIDITSCAGGVHLNLEDADVWYFSVQKCFGLPAGLGVAIISERAYLRSVELMRMGKNEAGIWAWEKLDETMKNDVYQTPQTPNVLNIYLLGSQCERWNKDGGLSKRSQETLTKKQHFEEWMLERKGCAFFVQDASHRSDTVFVVAAEQDDIVRAKELLKTKKIELGGGYGKIKKDTFRIANFPAISEKMMLETLDILGLHFTE
ncbi:MAG: hypothetical protein RIQ56_761 [Candidatus Parcubacteria bacterium]|jgi:phosphoserine aminotransferase